MMRCKEEKEAKKEAFRKYLESSGVLNALTKVLVSLYELNEKPSSALEFVQQKLGGPRVSEYEKLQAEISDLQTKYNELLVTHEETCKEVWYDLFGMVEFCTQYDNTPSMLGMGLLGLRSTGEQKPSLIK